MLKLADNLELPLDFMTERIAFLARTGAGKSGGMRVFFEQIFDAGQFTIFIDPKGDAWGIRAAGKKAGKAVLVMGGDHADVPLEATSGKVVAEFLVKERISTVLDISDFSTPDMWKFVAQFCATLYKLNREALHLFIDEADMLAGQTYFDPHTLHGIQLIQNKGRSRGFGVTVATQRPQILNKTVLNASGTLVAMQMIGDDALKIVKSWLMQTGTKEAATEILAAIPTLQTREAFVYSPQILGLEPRRIRFAEFQTFDSMRTPKPGEARQSPKSLADINLDAVKRDMAATIEKAKSEDPRLLQKRIAELERELKAKPAAASQNLTPKEVDREVLVPVLDEEGLAAIEAAVGEFHRDVADRCAEFAKTVEAFAATFRPAKTGPVYDALLQLRHAKPTLPVAQKSPGIPVNSSTSPRKPVNAAPSRGRVCERPDLPLAHVEILDKLSKPQRKILDVLASFEPLGIESLSKSNLAVFADVSPKSSSYANNLGTLRNGTGALGDDPLIEYLPGGNVKLTDMGRNFADASQFSATTNEELLEAWCTKLSGPQGKIVRALFEVYPESRTREDLASVVEASPTSSSYANNLGHLRSLGLIDYGANKTVFVTDLLFPFS